MDLDPDVVRFRDRQIAQGFAGYLDAGPEAAREVSRAVTRWRQAVLDTTGATGTVDPVRAVESLRIPSGSSTLRARIYRPVGEAVGVVTYFHGGGFVVGDLDTCDWQCRALAARTGVVVVSIDYSLAPEHPFPVAVNEAYDAVRWVCANETGPHGVHLPQAVAGDSAGGNLAATVAVVARDDDDVDLRAQLLIYPMLDPGMSFPSIVENGEGYMLDRATIEWFWRHYLGGMFPSPAAAARPLTARLDGLATAIVVTAGFDPFRDEGEEYARLLAEAGVPTRLMRYPTLVHGFFGWGAHVTAAQHAVDDVSAALREVLTQVPA